MKLGERKFKASKITIGLLIFIILCASNSHTTYAVLQSNAMVFETTADTGQKDSSPVLTSTKVSDDSGTEEEKLNTATVSTVLS